MLFSIFFQVTQEVRDLIESTMIANDETTLPQLQTLLRSHDIVMSTSTIDRIRRDLGFTYRGMVKLEHFLSNLIFLVQCFPKVYHK